MVSSCSSPWTSLVVAVLCACPTATICALSLSSLSVFHGTSLPSHIPIAKTPSGESSATLSMRKQKASDRRTRRMQRGAEITVPPPNPTVTSSPMASATWKHKSVDGASALQKEKTAGRGRARKRSMLYNTLASYQTTFLTLLTAEYRAEEEEVLGRINASVDDPLALETAGYALYDLYPERRGNLFSDEVYRLVKAKDATTTFSSRTEKALEKDGHAAKSNDNSSLPPNHKFSSNDVIILTLQPGGSGDFFEKSNLPTHSAAVSVEARVLSTGPTYVDIVLPGGAFEAAFGPAPNNVGPSGKGDPGMRLRADRFFSNIPYTRMVAALSQITCIPDKTNKKAKDEERVTASQGDQEKESGPYDKISTDELLRETILSTYAFKDASSILFRDTDACDLRELARMLGKPPLPNSHKLASQALAYVQSNPHGQFSEFNAPQITAIGAALSRRLTLIQGPPGTGKTTVASAIAFGFVHQCRNISSVNTKVLACAFSNVGADNLAEQLLRLGLKVVRIGKPSAVSKSLWEYTLDAAIDKDPDAQMALKNAAWATSQLTRKRPQKKGDSKTNKGGSFLSKRSKREVATAAVKASIQASNIAATKALREADVIVSTSVGAANSQLLAACGIVTTDDEIAEDGRLTNSQRKAVRKSLSSLSRKTDGSPSRQLAPDRLPPLSLPFVIVDEACQSVEPGNLIPLTATNSCRSLVLLGDPCQLPPTVKSDPSSPLAVSLMERLAATLPQPVIMTAKSDGTERDDSFLKGKPVKQAVSLLRSMESRDRQHIAYRKRFAGSLLLSVQYRMHPSISAFSSAVFYDELLATPSFLSSCRPFPEVLNTVLPSENPSLGVRFVNVGGRSNERRGAPTSYSKTVFPSGMSGEQTSYRNKPEALQIISALKELLSEQKGDAPVTIGIVTPYNGQVELIKSLMASDDEFQTLARSLESPIEVKSVDGYQGRERDVIIFSAVRSNRQGNIGFLSDWRRMNVALTRAKSALIVFGDLDTLIEGDKHWAAFGKWCKGVRCIAKAISVDSDASEDEAPPLS